jgi:hypothetical protein
MPRYMLKISRELHANLKTVAQANGISVSKLISGAVLACGQVDNPDASLIVGRADTLIGARTRKVKFDA